jgi:hypothetical protein
MALFKSLLASLTSWLPDSILASIKSPPLAAHLALLLFVLWLFWKSVFLLSDLWSLLNDLASLKSPRFAQAKDRLESGDREYRWIYWRDLWSLRFAIATMIIMQLLNVWLFLGQVELIYAAYSSTGVLDVFEVYQPVTFAPKSHNGCDLDMLLMEHSFGESYGVPFVGKYYLRELADI